MRRLAYLCGDAAPDPILSPRDSRRSCRSFDGGRGAGPAEPARRYRHGPRRPALRAFERRAHTGGHGRSRHAGAGYPGRRARRLRAAIGGALRIRLFRAHHLDHRERARGGRGVAVSAAGNRAIGGHHRRSWATLPTGARRDRAAAAGCNAATGICPRAARRNRSAAPHRRGRYRRLARRRSCHRGHFRPADHRAPARGATGGRYFTGPRPCEPVRRADPARPEPDARGPYRAHRGPARRRAV